MPNPKLAESRPTARRGLHEESSSPASISGSSPTMQTRTKEGRSPSLRRRRDLDDRKDADHFSDDNGDNSTTKDEVDRCTAKGSQLLYPDLGELKKPSVLQSGSSPNSNLNSKWDQGSSDKSLVTSRSPCISGTGPSTVSPKSLPVTPEKGSPGRKIHPPHSHSETRNRKRGVMPVIAIGFVLLLCLGIYSLHQSLKNVDELSDSKPKTKSLEEIYEDIKFELRFINSQFSQTRHFWIQLIGQLDTIMVKTPVQPAVILVVVPEGTEETAVCLLHKISQAVSDGFGDDRFVMYDVKSEVHKGGSHLKYDLHETLSKLEQSHAAIVHNIEKISGLAAMTFHAFCDNENAPYKQALIFLAISIPGKYEDLSEERLGNTIDDYLLGIWGEELMQKDVSAVVSRVANAPVLIKPEEPSMLKTFCNAL